MIRIGKVEGLKKPSCQEGGAARGVRNVTVCAGAYTIMVCSAYVCKCDLYFHPKYDPQVSSYPDQCDTKHPLDLLIF